MSADGQTIPEDILAAATAVEDEIMAASLNDLDTQMIIAKAILAERERNAQPRKKIIEAMCELPHSIDDEKVEFRFDPRRPGHNALNQLITQLEVRFGASQEEA